MKNIKANHKIKGLQYDLKNIIEDLEKASKENTMLSIDFVCDLVGKLDDVKYDIKNVSQILMEEV
jgi:hypothetical protein